MNLEPIPYDSVLRKIGFVYQVINNKKETVACFVEEKEAKFYLFGRYVVTHLHELKDES